MSALGSLPADGPAETYAVILGKHGRLTLPSKLRQRLDLHPGDRLVLMVDGEGGFRVNSAGEVARRAYGLYRDLAPGRSLADELIAERREDAEQSSPWTTPCKGASPGRGGRGWRLKS